MTLTAHQRGALEALYDPLRRFAGVVGPPEVEPDDLVQDAMVGALRRRPLEDYDDLGAYLRRSIVSLSTDHRRRFGRYRRVVAQLGRPRLAEVPEYPSEVEDVFDVDPLTRAVLFLVYVDGYTFDEAADLLDSTSNALRARASRAKKRLRAELERRP